MKAIEEHLNRWDHRRIRLIRMYEAELTPYHGRPRPSLQHTGVKSIGLGDQPPLTLVAQKNNVRILKLLLLIGELPYTADGFDRSPLHWACLLERVREAIALIDYGARLDDRDEDGQSPLQLALDSEYGGTTMAVTLVHFFAEARRDRRKHPYTTLAHACRFGHLAVIKALLAAGANVNESTMSPPLSVAFRHASCKVVRYLLAKGARTQVVSPHELYRLKEHRHRRIRSITTYKESEEKFEALRQYGLILYSSQETTPVEPGKDIFDYMYYQ